MNFVVKRLEVELTTPEYVFMSQDEEIDDTNHYMFFVQKGDCTVKVKDRINDIIEERNVRILNPGDHFGVSIYSIIMCRKSH